eukprot:6895580-Lingulodinium_polyedra.AAC.1
MDHGLGGGGQAVRHSTPAAAAGVKAHVVHVDEEGDLREPPHEGVAVPEEESPQEPRGVPAARHNGGGYAVHLAAGPLQAHVAGGRVDRQTQPQDGERKAHRRGLSRQCEVADQLVGLAQVLQRAGRGSPRGRRVLALEALEPRG